MADTAIEPLDDLDTVFELSASIADQKFRDMYEILVVRMRRDLISALGRPPSTLQALVCERTAFNYVLLKQKSAQPVGDTAHGGFRHMTEVKEFNAFWIGLAEQLNKMMQQADSAYRASLLASVGAIIRDTLAELIPDKVEQRVATDRLNLALASAGL